MGCGCKTANMQALFQAAPSPGPSLCRYGGNAVSGHTMAALQLETAERSERSGHGGSQTRQQRDSSVAGCRLWIRSRSAARLSPAPQKLDGLKFWLQKPAEQFSIKQDDLASACTRLGTFLLYLCLLQFISTVLPIATSLDFLKANGRTVSVLGSSLQMCTPKHEQDHRQRKLSISPWFRLEGSLLQSIPYIRELPSETEGPG